jgi:chromate reductase, NAD(P)H dehydrogenase (quinone)
MEASFTIAGLAGSLRRGSFNRSLLLAAKELAPPKLQITILGISDIPSYNQDLESTGIPDVVLQLRQQVRAADSLLIATPEYNHSVPGVLKNVIDWLSRPPRGNALEGKPTALMGASPGPFGTVRAQAHLRQSLVFTNSPTLLQPEVLVSRADEKFDSSGRLTDEATRKFLVGFLEAFQLWIARFATPRAESSYWAADSVA